MGSVDLIEALQKFGFGPEDNSDDEAVDVMDSVSLPSWQHIQVRLQNVSYNFMMRPEAKEVVQYEVDESEEEIEGHEEEEEDDFEEIGKLPSLHQLQLQLKTATDNFSSFELPFKPGDFLARWGGPNILNGAWTNAWATNACNAWPNAWPHGWSDAWKPWSNGETTETPTEEEIAAHPEIYSTENLTEEDKRVGYNHEGVTGCEHYLRNCKPECAECHRFYSCQLCHDEVEQHEMDRTLTKRMLCLHCKCPQPPNRECRFCQEVMADYFCGACNVWSDDPEKPIYHCEKCKICRVGRGNGIDTFHCDKCGICMALVVENNHKCIERAANSGCPVCLEDLFSSTKKTVFMPCGHPIHADCFTEYTKRYYRCPICAKSVFDTSALFRMIDEEVKREVLPPELANKVVCIVCQDCRLKSRTKYHLAGLKCETCGSYNTSQL